MRRFFGNLFGFCAAILGLLIVLKRVNRSLWTLQLFLNEFSWTVVILGLFSGSWAKSGSGKLFGLAGAALATVPLTGVPLARRDMQRMMREGLGEDYETHIPPVVRMRLTQKQWSLPATFGASYRENNVNITRDVAYVEREFRALKVDIYRPNTPPPVGKRYPIILSFHGGGWHNGDKGSYFAAHHRYLAAQGYVVIDAQYRFTLEPDHVRWDAQLDDVRTAIRWVKVNADDFNGDPARIALLGRSAGAQMVLSAAYRATDEFADTAVKAVIGYYAPTYLFLMGREPDYRVLALLGDTSYNRPKIYADASPFEFASVDSPPTLLLHGYADGLVSAVHTELLYNKLRGYGVPVVALRVPWGRHAFDVSMAGLGAQMTQYHLDRFLAWALYGKHSS